MAAIEDLQNEVSEALCKLSKDQLIDICDFLHISGPKQERVTRKSKMSLISHIVGHLEREEVEDLEDEGMSELLCLKDKINELVTVSEFGKINIGKGETEKQKEEQQRVQRELDVLQQSLKEKKSEMEALVSPVLVQHREHIQTLTDMSPVTPQNSTQIQMPAPVWRKEFKITGQIGELGQKDRLTFTSLARQIESGLSMGCPELEIVNAVIRAIVPGLQLRSYLEGSSGLTLPTLRRILRFHYQERGATELYRQLTSEVQRSKETPQNFIIRMLDLRQKVLFASQEAESGLKYDPALVQSAFLHTVLIGLQSDNVRSDLQPYLLNPKITDVVLLEKLNIACANEAERQSRKKSAVPERPAAVHSVQSDETPVEQKGQVKQHTPKLITDMVSELKNLSAEITQIKESMRPPISVPQQCLALSSDKPVMAGAQFQVQSPSQWYQQPWGPDTKRDQRFRGPGPVSEAHWFQPQAAPQKQYAAPQQQYAVGQLQQQYAAPQRQYAALQQQYGAPLRSYQPQVRRCFQCQQRGSEERCLHCYYCGSSEHFLAGCRIRGTRPSREGPLNGNGLPPRGRE